MDEKKVRNILYDLVKILEIAEEIETETLDFKNIPVENLEVVIEALEKQVPKKVDFEEDVTEDMCAECPSCGSFLGYQVDCLDENYQLDYCQHCGQKLDWTE